MTDMDIKPILAKEYVGQDVNGWIMSEKLNGVRAEWTGEELLTKTGKPIHAPGWFIEALPKGIAIEGELFAGYGSFEEVVAAVRSKTPSDQIWKKIRFKIFDAPEHKSGFLGRLEYAKNIIKDSTVADIIEHVFCEGEDHLKSFANDIISNGGEGAVVREQTSDYEEGGSNYYLKYKGERQDDEAEIVDYIEGKKYFEGQLIGFVCKWKSIVFEIKRWIPENILNNPSEIGAQITFSYKGLNNKGVPNIPKFMVVRDYE